MQHDQGRLSEPLPGGGSTGTVAWAVGAPARPRAPAERKLRQDDFAWFAYGLFAVFILAQFLMMLWFVFK